MFPKNIPFRVLYETTVPEALQSGVSTCHVPKVTPSNTSNTFIKIELAYTEKKFLSCKDSYVSTGGRQVGFDFKNVEGNVVYLGAISSTSKLIPNLPSSLTVNSTCLKSKDVSIVKISYIEAKMEKYWNPLF
ncbi:MAG: hypothetical protein HOP07_00925 [Bacteriovoracaceae bacterium]|nr:hypothetical protein [Bacteriovoracaceae bacterium]